MLVRRMSEAPLVLLALAACTSVSSADFSRAIAANGCTQEDIPGMEIFLSETGTTNQQPDGKPYIRIEVARARAGIPIDVKLSALYPDAAQPTLARATLHEGKGDWKWLSGSLKLSQAIPAGPVMGSYSFCAPDQRCFSGSFSASWRPGMARCG